MQMNDQYYAAVDSLVSEGPPDEGSPSVEPTFTLHNKMMRRSDLRNLPKFTWIYDGVLPTIGTGLLYGKPGSMKTFHVIDLMCRISTKKPFANREFRPSADRPVLYIPLEGVYGVNGRVSAWEEYNQTAVGDNFITLNHKFKFLKSVFGVIKPSDDFKALIRTIEAEPTHKRPIYIGVDTLSRAITGFDENSASAMSEFVNMATELAEVTGGIVDTVHHSNKSGGARGSSAVPGGMDIVREMINLSTSQKVKYQKVKEAQEPKPLMFEALTMRQSAVLNYTRDAAHAEQATAGYGEERSMF